jgi:hypothetical protein
MLGTFVLLLAQAEPITFSVENHASLPLACVVERKDGSSWKEEASVSVPKEQTSSSQIPSCSRVRFRCSLSIGPSYTSPEFDVSGKKTLHTSCVRTGPQTIYCTSRVT